MYLEWVCRCNVMGGADISIYVRCFLFGADKFCQLYRSDVLPRVPSGALPAAARYVMISRPVSHTHLDRPD